MPEKLGPDSDSNDISIEIFSIMTGKSKQTVQSLLIRYTDYVKGLSVKCAYLVIYRKPLDSKKKQ